MQNSSCLEYSDIWNNLRKDIKANFFAKSTEKCKSLGIFLGKFVGTCLIMVDTKVETLLSLNHMNKCRFDRITQSDTRPQVTVKNAKQKFLLTGQWSVWSCKTCIVNCFLLIYESNKLNWINLSLRLITESKSVKTKRLMKKINQSGQIDHIWQQSRNIIVTFSSQNCSRYWIVFSQLSSFPWLSLVAFGETIFPRPALKHLFRGDFE